MDGFIEVDTPHSFYQNIDAAPPCQQCIAQSKAVYQRVPQTNYELLENAELTKKLRYSMLDDLMKLEWEGIPYGKLVLPSIRWILRRHTLLEDPSTIFLYQTYIHSAWSLAQQFTRMLDRVQPRAVHRRAHCHARGACARPRRLSGHPRRRGRRARPQAGGAGVRRGRGVRLRARPHPRCARPAARDRVVFDLNGCLTAVVVD